LRDNDLTRLARWVIPGWLYMLLGGLFIGLDILISEPYRVQMVIDLIRQYKPPQEIILTLVAILAAASVPIGFIIYQIYFYIRWNSPFSKNGIFLFSPGRMWDINFISKWIDEEENVQTNANMRGTDVDSGEMSGRFQGWRGDNWANLWKESSLFNSHHRYKWIYYEIRLYSAIDKILSERSGIGFPWWDRHRYLHEVVHTLGAALNALGLAFWSYMFVKGYWIFWSYKYRGGSLIVNYVVIPILLTMLLHAVLHSEQNVFRSLLVNDVGENIEENDPVYYIRLPHRVSFIICRTVGRVLKSFCGEDPDKISLGHPSYMLIMLSWILFLTSVPGVLEGWRAIRYAPVLLEFILFMPFIVTFRTVRVEFKRGRIVFAMVLVMFTVISFLYSHVSSVIRLFDVGMYFNLLIYLTLWMVFFLNREGARFDLLSMENFLLMTERGEHGFNN